MQHLLRIGFFVCAFMLPSVSSACMLNKVSFSDFVRRSDLVVIGFPQPGSLQSPSEERLFWSFELVVQEALLGAVSETLDVQVTFSDVPDWFEESAGRAFVFPLRFVPNADLGVTNIHVIDIACGPEVFPVDSPNDLAARMVIAIYTGATDPAVAARVFDQMWLRHGEY